MSGEQETTSPVVNDEAGTAQAAGAPGTSTGGSEGQASQQQPQGDAGATEQTKEPSPLAKLKEKLTGIPAEGAAQAAPPPGAEDSPTSAHDDAPTPKAEAAAPDADAHDDDRLSDEEFRALSGKTQRRIRKLSADHKAALKRIDDLETQVDEGADGEVLGNGQYITDFMHQLRLTPQQMHESLQLLRGYLSCEPKALPGLLDAAQRLARLTGQPDPLTASAAVTPFAGRLTPRYQELIEVNGFTEDEVRLFAGALQKPTAAPAARAAAPARDVQPSGVPEPDPNRGRKATPEQAEDAEIQQKLNAQAGSTIVAFLSSQGVKDVRSHVERNLFPHMAAAAPGNDPERIPPHLRLKAVEVAHQRWLIDQASAAKRRPAGAQSIASSTSTARQPAQGVARKAALSPLASLRAKLVGP